MQIAIIDDLKSDRDLLKMFLKQYIVQLEIFSTSQEFETVTSFLSQFRADSYSLIFMDIYMDELSGVDAARKIYQIDKKCRIIFLTSSLTHAVESYEVNAAYYLVKPVTFERLSLALNTSCSSLFHQKENLIVSVKKVSMLIAYH